MESASNRSSLLEWLQALLAYSPVPGIRVESAVYALSHLQSVDSTNDLWKMLTLQRIGRGAFPFALWPQVTDNAGDNSLSDFSDPASVPAVTPRNSGEAAAPVGRRQEEPTCRLSTGATQTVAEETQ